MKNASQILFVYGVTVDPRHKLEGRGMLHIKFEADRYIAGLEVGTRYRRGFFAEVPGDAKEMEGAGKSYLSREGDVGRDIRTRMRAILEDYDRACVHDPDGSGWSKRTTRLFAIALDEEEYRQLCETGEIDKTAAQEPTGASLEAESGQP